MTVTEAEAYEAILAIQAATNEIARLKAINADLLEAMDKLLIAIGEGNPNGRALDLIEPRYVDKARAVIARARGQS